MASPKVEQLSRLLRTRSVKETLKAGAQIYLNFLALTRNGWCSRRKSSKDIVGSSTPPSSSSSKSLCRQKYLTNASLRYIKFMEIHKERKFTTPVPTRDISVVWAADMLRPNKYNHSDEDRQESSLWYYHQQHRLLQSGSMFQQATGSRWSIVDAITGKGSLIKIEKGVKSVPPIERFDTDKSGIVSIEERSDAITEWEANYTETAKIWRSETGTTYRVLPGMDLPDLKNQIHINNIEELVDAVESQSSFVDRILYLGPQIVNDNYINRAIDRYFKFLNLAMVYPNQMLVPTIDVDLIWHTHMLSPRDYMNDCTELIGRLLSHDAGIGKGEISGAFESTKQKWYDTYGQPFVATVDQPKNKKKVETNKKADQHYAGCGSCGWGDSHYHSNLQHKEYESHQVEEMYNSIGLERNVESSSYDSSDDNFPVWAHHDNTMISTKDNNPWSMTMENYQGETTDSTSFWGTSSDGSNSGDDGGGDCGSCGGGCGGD